MGRSTAIFSRPVLVMKTPAKPVFCVGVLLRNGLAIAASLSSSSKLGFFVA